MNYHCAGKVFLLGEYAVLTGLPALIAAVAPRFEFNASENSEISTSEPFGPGSPFDQRSPAGRLLKWANGRGAEISLGSFSDPHHGAGGFGASTAQFALLYLHLAQQLSLDRNWESVWKLYRELTADAPLPPSGADLVAQWQGGVTLFDPEKLNAVDVWPEFDWSSLLVFSATARDRERKVPTHQHLNELIEKGFPGSFEKLLAELESSLLKGISAVREGVIAELGRALDEYADALYRAGLEDLRTSENRNELRELPDVLGVKGAGALQSDAILVLVKPHSPHLPEVIQAAESKGLQLITAGLPVQHGVKLQVGERR